jgi:RNA polymerase sigma factor (sigma-70 family)
MRESSFDVDRWQAALAHQRPLLALAERLLGDRARADDAVAHAMLQESRGAREPKTPPLRFLRAVVRNFARSVQRDETVRKRHESAAAPLDTEPAAVDLAAREQLRRRVAEAVLALDEPYRTTVALVYPEELPVAAAAAQLGITEATVRVRLHRAREGLRRRLDREFGSRAAWAMVLGWGESPVAAPAMVFGVVVGGFVMKKVLALAVVVLLLLGVGAFAPWNWFEPTSQPIVGPAQIVTATLAAPPPEEPVRELAVPEPIVPPPAPTALSQHFRCIDERGQPVANAEVRLVRMPWGSGVPDLVARSDADGKVVVAEVVLANYQVRAHEGERHYVAKLDPWTLPGAPRDLLLRELWIGGVVMPEVELVADQVSYTGFMFTDHLLAGPAAERALIAAWRAKHPNASFWAAVHDPERPYREEIDVKLQWFGHQTNKRQVRMWPASQFPGPEVIDPATVPLRDWVRCRRPGSRCLRTHRARAGDRSNEAGGSERLVPNDMGATPRLPARSGRTFPIGRRSHPIGC